MTACAARFILHPENAGYDFGPTHPLRPERIDASVDLLRTMGILHDADILQPRMATVDDLEPVHDPSYIAAVQDAGSIGLPRAMQADYGLGSMDNPPFPHMHEASALVCGGTLAAVSEVLGGRALHAFNGPGGLHHAHRARASGFCIYNDAAVAIASAVRQFQTRVLYLDFDAHHGDGVQWLFYGDPNVLTVSMHEDPRFLFPGTGTIRERGTATGTGFCVNMPFSPHTGDEDWQEAISSLIPAIAARFRPDLIVSNHGCDTHALDPLTHLSLSTRSLAFQATLVHDLAHDLCGGRWVAVGSGGYDWRRVVPRSWALVWSTMTARPLPERLPVEWAERWDVDYEAVPGPIVDPPEDVAPPHTGARESNRHMVRAVALQEGLNPASLV